MQNAVAFANNDVATIAWSYGRRPEGCMGFALYRIDQAGRETVLPSHAVFPGATIRPGQTTAEFPIQKFYWKDPYARLVAERTGNRTFRYRITPLEGRPGALRPMANLPQLVTNAVTLSSKTSRGVYATFNRGLISTQRVSRALRGARRGDGLLAQVADPANPLRASLSGDMVETLTEFVDRARASGKIYAALYELHDEELIAKLESLGRRLHIVLSNAAATDPETRAKSDGNQGARDRLAGTAGTLWNRIMPSGHIGHNKFLVHVDRAGRPRAALFGSTNWTSTGLCTQTNNTMVVEDAGLAQRYLDYWQRLAADTEEADGDARALQARALRRWNGAGESFALSGGRSIESWFSPNTPRARSRAAGERRPPDMAAVIERIDAAEQAILFLAFYPGSPSLANWTAAALRRNRDLFVRGCVTNTSASEGFYYELKGSSPPRKPRGDRSPPRQDPRVIGAEAFDGRVIPEGWQREILRAGFAVIHDKVLVVDPFSDRCVVVIGSHNLGHRASYDNDENLVIVEGDKDLAVAYATHVLDVYDHFAWRYTVKHAGPQGGDQFLKTTPDKWLDRYFAPDGRVKVAQLRFWMQATL